MTLWAGSDYIVSVKTFVGESTLQVLLSVSLTLLFDKNLLVTSFSFIINKSK